MALKRKKKASVESMILSNRIVFLNWTAPKCAPCTKQKKKLMEIKQEIESPQISIFNVNYNDYKKKFKKLDNVVVPSLNVFVDGAPLTVIDTKMSPRKRVGIFNKKEKIIEKETKAITGERSKSDLIKLFKYSLEKIID